MDRVDQLFEQLRDVNQSQDRAAILTLLYTRIAAGLELKEKGSETFFGGAGSA